MKKIIAFLLFAILLQTVFLLFPQEVFADMGPKPKLIITVVNPPQSEYYLDLLVDYDLPLSENLGELRDALDRKKIKLIEDNSKDGWYAALVHGTRVPLWGKLTGEPQDGTMKHTFGYFGVPDNYKIIIVTSDNEVIITRTIHRKSYTSEVIYNYLTGEITEQGGLTLAWTYTKQFLMSLFVTLIIEGFWLLVFRFKTVRSLTVFFFVNLSTQALLTIVVSTSQLLLGIYASYIVLIFSEIIIGALESILYIINLKEGKKTKRVAYAIVANLSSALASLPLMYLEYKLFIT